VIDFNVVREIDLMYVFSYLLVDDAYDWFQEDVPIKSIASLADLLKVFPIKWHHKDIHYVELLVEQFLVRLPKENHIETPQDSSLDCDEHILEIQLKFLILTRSSRNVMNHLFHIFLMRSLKSHLEKTPSSHVRKSLNI